MRRTLLTALTALVALLVAVPAGAASAAVDGPFQSYATYASAPNEILGKSATGVRKLTAAEAAQVPKSQIVARASQFLRWSEDGSLYKVVWETVTPISEALWRAEGEPTPKVVPRVPALEYYTYASAPTEMLVRSPLAVWRQAKPAEYTSVPESQITRRVGTFFIQNVGETQIYKKSGGVTVAISRAQWVGEGSPKLMVPEVPAIGENPFTAHTPYVDPGYPSVAAAAALRAAGNEADAAQVDKISRYAGSLWIGDWTPEPGIRAQVSKYVQSAINTGQTGVLVPYAIPGRACYGHSAGGLTDAGYRSWIAEVVAGIDGRRVGVILEPDALLQLGRCPELEGDRIGLLNYATKALTDAGATVYLDAGSSYSVKPVDMAQRLLDSGVSGARGFAANVSNFMTTADVQAYSDEVSRLLGGKKYVIDTSRNGLGSNGEWCNPRGRALGAVPGAVVHGNQDASLWIKTIGASDGPCNGGPAAGKWWTEIAVEMAKNSTIAASSTSPTAMTSQWNVGIAGCSTITLPLGGTVEATIDWGDGTKTQATAARPTHTYAEAAGARTITIDGKFTAWGGDDNWSAECLTRVSRWADTGTTSLNHGFAGAVNLIDIAALPATATDLSWLLADNTTYDQDVSAWDMSKVTDISHMFDGATAFSRPLAAWNVSSVTNMSGTFAGATAFNQPLNSWNTSAVTDMSGMFEGATAYHQPLDGWKTGNVTTMSAMFAGATRFSQPLKTWDVSKVTTMERMFAAAPTFNQNLSTWNVARVTDFTSMFDGAAKFNQPLATWNTVAATKMDRMFAGAALHNQGSSTWNTSSVTSMAGMFDGATAFNKSLRAWDVARVTERTRFADGSALTAENLPLFR